MGRVLKPAEPVLRILIRRRRDRNRDVSVFKLFVE